VTGGEYREFDERLKHVETSINTLAPKIKQLEEDTAAMRDLAKVLIEQDRLRTSALEAAKPTNPVGRIAVGALRFVTNVGKTIVDALQNMVELFEKLPLAGPVIKTAWQTKNEVMGVLFSVLSGDFLDRQPEMGFDQNAAAPAVVFVNGIKNTQKAARTLANDVFKQFGVESGTRISNDTHGPLGVQDFIQIIGHEYFGAYDRPVHNMVKAIRLGIEQKGEVYVVAHSQGTAIFARSLEKLTAQERSKIHYYGAGSEWYVDPIKHGLASGENVWNKRDVIPIFGNYLRQTNLIAPAESSRKFRPVTRVIGDEKSWRAIEVPWPGEGSRNHHNFALYYMRDMQIWAKRMMADRQEIK
jgi:hypothetical protein